MLSIWAAILYLVSDALQLSPNPQFYCFEEIERSEVAALAVITLIL
jgi:hypothetical protein